jgi:hypothetical protein
VQIGTIFLGTLVRHRLMTALYPLRHCNLIGGISASEPFINDLTPAEKLDIWGETVRPGQYEGHGNLTTDTDAAF